MSRLPRPAATLGFVLSPNPVRAAFQRRTLDAVNRIAAEAPAESLAHALGAATDVGTLARILSDGAAIGPAISTLEPLAPLIARNAEHRLELMERCGGALTAEQTGQLIGVTRQAIDKRRRAGALIGVRQGANWAYPRCQFDELRREVVNGLPGLLTAMSPTNPWVALDFLMAPDDALGGKSPLDVLRSQGFTRELERLVRIGQGDGFA